MGRQEQKLRDGAQQYLEPGEQILAALVAQARGQTQRIAGSLQVGATQMGKHTGAAADAGLQIDSPMGLILTNRRLMTLKIGMPIGLGIGGAVKDFLSAVPVGAVDSIEPKRLAAGYSIHMTVNGQEFKLESGAGSGAKELPGLLESAKAGAA